MRDSDPIPRNRPTQTFPRLWTKCGPGTVSRSERVAVLEAAASAVTAKNLTASEREAAHAAAHKLAGSLGMFNLERGTDLARELEAAYKLDRPPLPMRPLAWFLHRRTAGDD